jgi:hypothetical protein
LLPESHAPLQEWGEGEDAETGSLVIPESAADEIRAGFMALAQLVFRSARNLMQQPNDINRQAFAAPSAKAVQVQASERLFVSLQNDGATELLNELPDHIKGSLAVVHDAAEIKTCARILLYLDGATWTSGEQSDALAAEVGLAMGAGLQLILAHEMPGVGQVKRGVHFSTFFACAEGTTPSWLLKMGIYDTIAVPLKGGPWRQAGLTLLKKEFAKPVERQRDSENEQGSQSKMAESKDNTEDHEVLFVKTDDLHAIPTSPPARRNSRTAPLMKIHKASAGAAQPQGAAAQRRGRLVTLDAKEGVTFESI